MYVQNIYGIIKNHWIDEYYGVSPRRDLIICWNIWSVSTYKLNKSSAVIVRHFRKGSHSRRTAAVNCVCSSVHCIWFCVSSYYHRLCNSDSNNSNNTNMRSRLYITHIYLIWPKLIDYLYNSTYFTIAYWLVQSNYTSTAYSRQLINVEHSGEGCHRLKDIATHSQVIVKF